MYLGLPWIDAYQPKLNYASRRMLFKGNKVSERGRFQKVATEDAAEFDCIMQDPRIEVYACSISFIG